MTEVVEVTNNLLHPNTDQIHLDESPESITSNTNNNTSNPWKEFDMLTAVVSRYHLPLEKGSLPPFNPLALNLMPTSAAPSSSVSPMNATNPNDHRISCHRCGNIRKRKTVCSRANCPHTFCGRCSDKLRLEYGPEVFNNGCPVCKDLCCCSNKSVNCTRKFHCYRKCPATKVMNSKTCLPVSTASSPNASAMTMPSNNDGSNDETTSVEENSSNNSLIGQKQHRMNALLEACANFDEKPVDEDDVAQRKSNKRQKTMKPQEAVLTGYTIDPTLMAGAIPATTTKSKREKKSNTATSNTQSMPPGAMSMASYPMSFYGFPHAAMAAAGPYGMIPLVPAHMLSGYNLPAQYSHMAGFNATEENEENSSAMMYGKGVPPLIPVFPYYMHQYAAAQAGVQATKVSKGKAAPLSMSTANGINLLAAVSSHYLSDEEENGSKRISAPTEIPSN